MYEIIEGVEVEKNVYEDLTTQLNEFKIRVKLTSSKEVAIKAFKLKLSDLKWIQISEVPLGAMASKHDKGFNKMLDDLMIVYIVGYLVSYMNGRPKRTEVCRIELSEVKELL